MKMPFISFIVPVYNVEAYFFYENGSRGRDVLTFLEDAELKSIMSDGYKAYVFIGDELKSARFKNTVHQVYVLSTCNKFFKASNHGGEGNTALFHSDFKELYGIERKRDAANLTPKERLKER